VFVHIVLYIMECNIRIQKLTDIGDIGFKSGGGWLESHSTQEFSGGAWIISYIGTVNKGNPQICLYMGGHTKATNSAQTSINY
jgi:hypothetical protein